MSDRDVPTAGTGRSPAIPMTPEERAATLTDRWAVQYLNRTDTAAMLVQIAAAIREAVDAETEACAEIAADWEEPLDPPNGAAHGIARMLRQRAEARRGARPDAAP